MPRPYLLFFGGSIQEGNPWYSGGARQAFHDHVMLRNDARVKFGGSLEDYL